MFKKTNIKFISNLIFLFLYSLSNPRITYPLIIVKSLLVITKLFVPTLIYGINKNIKHYLYKSFVFSISILCLFSTLYFYTSYNYNFINESELLVGLTLPTLSYFVGYSINFFKPSNRPLDFVYSVVALIGGGVTYVYLSIINNPLAAATTEIEISNRSVPSFWAAHTTINGPAMDLYSMLGMSLISLVIFGKPNNIKLKNYLFITIASLTFSLMALYSSLALQGRKTFVSLALVIVIAIFFNLKKQTISNDKFLTIVKLFILFILFIIGLNTFNMLFEYLNETYGIFRRFNSEGLDTPRYLVWMEVLQGMPENLLGGRMFKISANFAHNLWLDVLYDCGLFPLLLLLIFHFLQVKAIGKICLSKFHKNDIINICLIATLVSFLFGWQAEPVIQASVYYFSMTCCFFGLVMRFAQTIDNHNHGRQTT